jgi:hypothetical protein
MSKKAMDHVDARELADDALWRREADEVRTDEPVEVVVKRPPARKDTKHWCKGKVGREHTPAIELPANAWRRTCGWTRIFADEMHWSCVHVELCTACGKHLRPASGWLRNADHRHFLMPEECPQFKAQESGG